MTPVFSDCVFRPDFDLNGPHLVAASAGTGKTYSIQSLYLRLVAEKGFRVGQIQVMTFTEAATRDLRDKIRKALSEAASAFAADGDGIAEDERSRFEGLRLCVRANLPGPEDAAERTALARLELALMEFDQAAISTIHGFCRRILSRFAFETGGAFKGEIGDGRSAGLERCVRDWWRTGRARLAEEERDGLSLGSLEKCVAELSRKVDWIVAGDCGPGTGPGARALELAGGIVQGYEAARQTREEQTFDDLLRAVREALRDPAKGPGLAARLREEFRAALIDEFQDTDGVQYDIFRRVFLDPSASPRPALFFVGDPKQAIYAFRGGDIYTYREAAMLPDVARATYRLERNFRSTPRLIDAVNALFGDVRRPDGSFDRTFGDDAIAYEEPLLASDRIPAFVLPDGRDDPQPFRIVFAKDSGEREEATVRAVLEVLEEQREAGITPKDVAVLVSSHKSAASYCAALRDRGVPAVLQRAGSVFAGRAAGEFLHVVLAMALRGGRRQMRTALATSFFDFTPCELRDGGSEAVADMAGAFAGFNRLWLERGFAAAFAALESHPRCDLRRRLAAESGGERALADISQLVDLAHAAQTSIGPSPDSLADWLSERIRLAADGAEEADAEEYARRLESESDAVRIMTIHVSKGLQFPVVVVPLSGGAAEKPPYFFHDGNGALNVSMDDSAREAADAERDAERLRLLYVAFTRATRRTTVVAIKEKAGAPFERLLGRAQLHCAGEDGFATPIRCEAFEPDAGSAARYLSGGHDALELLPAREPRSFPGAPIRGSYSSLSPSDHSAPGDGHDFDGTKAEIAAVSSPEEDAPAILRLGGGAKTGVCWHEILENLPFSADDALVLRETRRAMRLHGLASPDPARFDSDAELVAGMVKRMLDWPFSSPDGGTFRLRDVPDSMRASEWEFSFSTRDAATTTEAIAAVLRRAWAGDEGKRPFLEALEGWRKAVPRGFMKGYVDLFFRMGDAFYIIDWKSNALGRRAEDFTREGILREMAKTGYFFQYLLYSCVLHVFLKETMGREYSWERNFGGVRYCFLRGVALGLGASVFEDRPGEALLDELAAALGLGACDGRGCGL